ncbi:hypothetical protein [Nitrososphaera viennensis]|uniref:Uncharacterized protein n=2 Tax=Nitrososphaera viennensis TaxID=1034015 RepID=A0A060HJM0_9ARCH|nr:hypothetical protein [Nitrososphaera viennensis]AIC15718.1 hypothetical protein NVIE_014770 [Nitrososphaera viennensis EN76]UVS70591.1 hypothetical protein NWT39_07335 [Nitrososphaera viennensis]
MNPQTFDRFTKRYKGKLPGMSDSERVRTYMAWCKENHLEEVVLRLSSESKGGWSKNFTLDFTTERVIVSKKSFLAKFADLGYVAGLAPYPYLLTMNNNNDGGKDDTSKIRKQANFTPEDLLRSENFGYSIWYSDMREFTLRKGWETMVTNMMGRAIVSNFLTIKTTDGKTYDFTLPVNKNGLYESVFFWLGVALPIRIAEK